MLGYFRILKLFGILGISIIHPSDFLVPRILPFIFCGILVHPSGLLAPGIFSSIYVGNLVHYRAIQLTHPSSQRDPTSTMTLRSLASKHFEYYTHGVRYHGFEEEMKDTIPAITSLADVVWPIQSPSLAILGELHR